MSLTSVPVWPASPAVEMRVCSEILAGRGTPHRWLPSIGAPCGPCHVKLGIVADGMWVRGWSPLGLHNP